MTPATLSATPATVAMGFVSGMLAGLPRAGIDAGSLLDRAEIARELIHRREARVPVARYAELYRLINRQLDDEGFALFSRPLRLGSFELLCRATLSAATLEDALERIARFLRVLVDEFEVEVGRTATSALLAIDQEHDLPVGPAGRVFAYEWLLRLIHGLAAWLVARPLALDEVAFPYPPPLHAGDYELVFAPRYTFDAPRLEARFPLEYLAMPVRRDEAALRAFLAAAPASITTLYRRDRSLALRVREQLRAALPRPLKLGEVAARLHLSPRTLHRRLEDEDTSLRLIRETLRRDLAVDWLAKSRRPLGRIAADLGYSDAGAFYRAFTAWEHCGPREYRARVARDLSPDAAS